MACIAVAIVDASGFLIKPDRFTRPNSLAHLDPIINMDFINITSTHVCTLESEEKGTILKVHHLRDNICLRISSFCGVPGVETGQSELGHVDQKPAVRHASCLLGFAHGVQTAYGSNHPGELNYGYDLLYFNLLLSIDTFFS
jgi:hypothetical protein